MKIEHTPGIVTTTLTWTEDERQDFTAALEMIMEDQGSCYDDLSAELKEAIREFYRAI